jgi:hypothetical protein
MLVLFGKHLSMEPWLHAASAILFLAVTLQTFLLFVPLHRRLSSQNCEKEGENPGSEATVENDKGRGEKDRSPVIRRMIYLNWGRTLCQSARVVVALAIAA